MTPPLANLPCWPVLACKRKLITNQWCRASMRCQCNPGWELHDAFSEGGSLLCCIAGLPANWQKECQKTTKNRENVPLPFCYDGTMPYTSRLTLVASTAAAVPSFSVLPYLPALTAAASGCVMVPSAAHVILNMAAVLSCKV